MSTPNEVAAAIAAVTPAAPPRAPWLAIPTVVEDSGGNVVNLPGASSEMDYPENLPDYMTVAPSEDQTAINEGAARALALLTGTQAPVESPDAQPAPVAAEPAQVTPPPVKAAEASNPAQEAMMAAIQQLAATVSQLVPKAEAPKAEFKPRDQVSRADLLRNPTKVLRELGIDPASLEPAVNYAKQGDEAPETAHLRQQLLDLQDQQAAMQASIEEGHRQLAFQQAQAALESEITKSISVIDAAAYPTAAKLSPKFVKDAVTATIEAYRRTGIEITPAEAIKELEPRWRDFANMLGTQAAQAPTTAPSTTAPTPAQTGSTSATPTAAPRPLVTQKPSVPAARASAFDGLRSEEASNQEASRRAYEQFLKGAKAK